MATVGKIRCMLVDSCLDKLEIYHGVVAVCVLL